MIRALDLAPVRIRRKQEQQIVGGNDGTDNTNGKDGKDGTDGKDNTNGKDGKDGKVSTSGTDGTNGKDSTSGTCQWAWRDPGGQERERVLQNEEVMRLHRIP